MSDFSTNDSLNESLINRGITEPSAFNRFGIYSAICEYNADPLQLGRIIVRVVALHKDEYGVERLPWARPCAPFGGGPGYGTYMIPPVGSLVWVTFEGGNELYPVWMGTWISNPVADRKMLQDTKGEYPKGPVSMAPVPGTPWTAPAAPGIPKDAAGQSSHRPEIYVPFRSPKGAAIVIDDRDGKEKLSILDRLGQSIIFECATSIGANYNNASSRGVGSTGAGTGLPIDRTESQEARMVIADVGGNSIEFYSKRNPADVAAAMPDLDLNNWAGRIRISSKQPTNETSTTSLTETKGGPTETEGKNAVTVELSGSDGKLSIDISKDGAISTSIHIDGATGNITLDTPTSITLKSDHIKLDGDVSITGNLKTQDVQIDNDLIISGKLIQ